MSTYVFGNPSRKNIRVELRVSLEDFRSEVYKKFASRWLRNLYIKSKGFCDLNKCEYYTIEFVFGGWCAFTLFCFIEKRFFKFNFEAIKEKRNISFVL